MTSSISSLLILAIPFMAVVQVFGRHLWNYRLTDDAFQLVIVRRFPLRSIPYENIASVQLLTFGQTLGVGVSSGWGNRFYAKQGALITKRNGWFNKILITPDDPVSFVEKLQDALLQCKRTTA